MTGSCQRRRVLTGDSLPPGGVRDALPGLNLCGAGRVVCLIDPVGDVYACPFAIHDSFKAGSVREPGASRASAGLSALFAELRASHRTAGACSPVTSSTLPGRLHGGQVLHRAAFGRSRPECVRGLASRR